jgi:hypothetical protein
VLTWDDWLGAACAIKVGGSPNDMNRKRAE